MSLTKLSLAGSLVSDIPSWDGKPPTLFYSVRVLTWKYVCLDRVNLHGVLRYELDNNEDLFHTKE
jgi:hypothetical protein